MHNLFQQATQQKPPTWHLLYIAQEKNWWGSKWLDMLIRVPCWLDGRGGSWTRRMTLSYPFEEIFTKEWGKYGWLAFKEVEKCHPTMSFGFSLCQSGHHSCTQGIRSADVPLYWIQYSLRRILDVAIKLHLSLKALHQWIRRM